MTALDKNAARFVAIILLSSSALRPESLDAWLARSNLIVLGRLHIDVLRYPWFDGWHYGGVIDVTETLSSRSIKPRVRINWTEPFDARRRAYCGHLTSDDDGQAGIWFLQRSGHDVTLSEVGSLWCNGPLSLDMRDAILDGIAQHRKR